VPGADGMSLSDNYLSAFDRHWNDISAGMGKAARKLFDVPAARMRDDLAKRLWRHEAEQREALQSQARPETSAMTVESAAAEAADAAGATEDAFSPEAFGRKVVEPVVNHQLSQNRVSDARKFLDRYRDGMTPGAADALEVKVAGAEGHGQGSPVEVAAGYGFLPEGLRNVLPAKGFGGTMSDVAPDSDGYDWSLQTFHPDAAQQKALKIVADRAGNPWVRFDDKRGTLVDVDPLDPRKQTPMTTTRMQGFLEGFFNVPNATTETLPKAFDDLVRKEAPDYDPLAKPKKVTRQQENLAAAKANLQDPRVQAYLATISYAEGGTQYDSMFGDNPNGKRVNFKDFSKFPGASGVKFGKQKPTANGRYQINGDTYDDNSKALGLDNFFPETQDLMATHMLDKAGVIEALRNGDFARAVNLSGRWASFPKLENGKWVRRYSKQPFVEYEKLQQYYENWLKTHSNQDIKNGSD
jgi:muramidase (phage lysozyme)